MTSTTALLVTSTFCTQPGFMIIAALAQKRGDINREIQRPLHVLRPLRCAELRTILVWKVGCSHFDLHGCLVTQSMPSSK